MSFYSSLSGSEWENHQMPSWIPESSKLWTVSWWQGGRVAGQWSTLLKCCCFFPLHSKVDGFCVVLFLFFSFSEGSLCISNSLAHTNNLFVSIDFVCSHVFLDAWCFSSHNTRTHTHIRRHTSTSPLYPLDQSMASQIFPQSHPAAALYSSLIGH